MDEKIIRQWTLMFYFASDNPLASAIVSQLKAIKAAGFHKEANVLAYFDPQPKNMPSHVFDVNLVEKLKRPGTRRFSFKGDDAFVRNLVFDRLWTEEDSDTKESLQQYFKKEKHIDYESETVPATLTREQSPRDSLHGFLEFCRMNYPASHYMLIILGHGVVVGNDIFLLDENVPDVDDAVAISTEPTNPPTAQMVRKSVRNSLTLKGLGEELIDFTSKIGKEGQLELLGLHSCSMSGLEVAFELQGTANYLLASQGPAFVGSWPYRQILTRVFNDLNKRENDSKTKLKDRLKKIFAYCIQNSYDFQLAGYSFDIALCDLSVLKADKKKSITVPLNELSSALIKGLKARDGRAKEIIKGLILLAHWDAQSFWQEQYTDLYDFCFRLSRRCEDYAKTGGYAKAVPGVKTISAACKNMIKVLKQGKQGAENALIVRSGFIGPLFQYSHGLSVFFPWSEPVDRKFLERYAKYKFTIDSAKGDTWLDFLNTYFVETRRELDRPVGKPAMENRLLAVLQKVSNSISGGDGLGKGPGDPTGDSCECPTIKNYPSSTEKPSPNVADRFEEQFQKAAV